MWCQNNGLGGKKLFGKGKLSFLDGIAINLNIWADLFLENSDCFSKNFGYYEIWVYLLFDFFFSMQTINPLPIVLI
jgi:hypothetical protein